MNAYLISMDDRAGGAAAIFEAAAARGVNVFPAYGLADGTHAIALVGSDDEVGLRAALADAGVAARPVELIVRDIENAPGAGAALMRRIAGAGVSLLAAVPIDMDGSRVRVAFGADDPAALRKALEG